MLDAQHVIQGERKKKLATRLAPGHHSDHGANGFRFTGLPQRPHQLQSMRCPYPRRRGSSNGSAAPPCRARGAPGMPRRRCLRAGRGMCLLPLEPQLLVMPSSWEGHVPAAPGAAAAGTGGEALDPSPWLPLAASQLAGRRRWPPLATAARPGGGRCLAHRPGVDGIS